MAAVDQAAAGGPIDQTGHLARLKIQRKRVGLMQEKPRPRTPPLKGMLPPELHQPKRSRWLRRPHQPPLRLKTRLPPKKRVDIEVRDSMRQPLSTVGDSVQVL